MSNKGFKRAALCGLSGLLLTAQAYGAMDTRHHRVEAIFRSRSNAGDTSTPVSAQETMAKLVKRLTPEFQDKIIFDINAKQEKSTLSTRERKLVVTAPSVREAARAYGYYLRHFARVHFSWNGDNRNGERLALPTKSVTVPEALPDNFAYNYCTLSYTCMHWDKKRWSRELDVLALSGYKYVLVTAGLEKVWQGFLKDLKYPEDKIKAFIPSPVYSAWFNMGNMEGEGSPVSQSLIDSEAELGRFIVKRCRELGMEPVLQGYVGFLPQQFPASAINGTIIPQGKWCGYDRPSVLQPTCPAFQDTAALWYKNLHRVYGMKAKAYGGDLFHEGGRKGNTNLTEAAKAVQSAMQKASPNSIWFLQAWGHNPDAALLNGTDKDKTIILFLNKNLSQKPSPGKPFNFQGRRHVWCELANFGGNHGLFGGFPILEELSGNAGGYSGLGLLSEGLETNPLYYALFTERINTRDTIKRKDFIRDLSLSRYGMEDADITAYMNLLAESVYHPDKIREGCLENIMCARPGLKAKKASTWSDPSLYYNTDKVEEAAKHLLAAGRKAGKTLTGLPTYRYDLADVCRQVLADRARKQLEACRQAFDNKDEKAFLKESQAFIDLMDQEAAILATSRYFLLGHHLAGIADRASNAKDKKYLQQSFLQLISRWKPKESLLNDYANREYSELVEFYYKERWKAYFRSCIDTLHGTAGADAIGQYNTGSTSNTGEDVKFAREKNSKVDAIEVKFPSSNIPLKTKASGDILKLAEEILGK